MKKRTILTMMVTVFTIIVSAKDIKTVVFTTQPQMHCENCENKIKGNLRFEKGVKKIETNIEKQEVTVTFDSDKTTEEKIKVAFEKFGYEACTLNPDNQDATNDTSSPQTSQE